VRRMDGTPHHANLVPGLMAQGVAGAPAPYRGSAVEYGGLAGSGLRRARSEPASRAEEGSRPRETLGPAAHSDDGRKLSAPGTA
jgi:hypothetical protein